MPGGRKCLKAVLPPLTWSGFYPDMCHSRWGAVTLEVTSVHKVSTKIFTGFEKADSKCNSTAAHGNRKQSLMLLNWSHPPLNCHSLFYLHFLYHTNNWWLWSNSLCFEKCCINKVTKCFTWLNQDSNISGLQWCKLNTTVNNNTKMKWNKRLVGNDTVC